MATQTETPHQGPSRTRSLLVLAAGVLAVNLLVLCVLYLLPMPDPSTLPGRTPAHDVQPGSP